MRSKVAIVTLAAFATSLGATAADRPEQRLACQDEARQHISGPRRVDVDLYTRVIERRKVYILDCMESGSRDVEQTGSIPVPQPPVRPLVNNSPSQ